MKKLPVWGVHVSLWYSILSIVTLPFLDALWVGELAVLALVQLPKILPANLIARNVLIPALMNAGHSSSPSPAYTVARPYGLLMVYLLPALIILTGAVVKRKDLRKEFGLVVLAAAGLLCLDFVFTLMFAKRPGLTLY